MLRFQTDPAGDGTPAPGGEADPTPTPDPTPAPPSVSPEEVAELKQLVEQQGMTMAQVVQALQGQSNVPDPDPDDEDIDAYIERIVESRVAPMRPLVQAAAQRQGEETMKKMFSDLSKNPEIGDFDYDLAERAAHSFYQETGDPQKAVEEGAKYASQVRKAERDAAVQEYQASLKKGPHDLDPAVAGSGAKSKGTFKTMDEVIAAWDKSGQTEV